MRTRVIRSKPAATVKFPKASRKDKKPRSRLGDYFTLQRGTTYKSSLLGHPGPVLLGLATIQRNGGFRSDSLQTYGGDSPDKLMVEPGEIYVSLKDVTQSADLLGAVARLPYGRLAGRLTQDTVKLEPKSDDVPLDYLYWLLRTPQYRAYCRAHSTGTTNLGLSRDDFLAFPAPEPTPKQLLLVETLRTLDAKMDLDLQMNRTLEATAQAIFKHWFIDFEFPDEEGRPYRSSGGQMVYDKELRKEVPKGWKIGKLGAMCKIIMGQSPPGDTYNEVGNGIPFHQGTKDFGFRFPTRRVFCTSPTRLAEDGDILLSVRAPIGILNVANERCCIGRGVASIRHQANLQSFLYNLLMSTKSDWNSFEAEGTVFGAVTKSDVNDFAVTTPPNQQQSRFNSSIEPLDTRVRLNEEESKGLSELRDSLLPRLMSGKIRVPVEVR